MRAVLAAASLSVLGACRTVGAPGVPVTIESLDGMPAHKRAAVIEAVKREATLHEIEMSAGGKTPRYFLRGYLSVRNDDGGSQLGFVWDIFDGEQRRARRITADVDAAATSPETWDGIGDEQIRQVSAKAMNEVAAFLAEAE